MISSSDWLLDDRVQNLLAEWTDRRDAGEPVTVGELCGDDSALAERLSAAIDKLARTEWMVASGGEPESTALLAEHERASVLCEFAAAIPLDELVRRIKTLGIVASDTLQHAAEVFSNGDSPELARQLLDSGQLTRFQLRRIMEGRGAELLLSDYVLLDTIGAGGMGQVFRALHRTMHRVVAVKIMLSRSFRSEDAVVRFQREVEAAARLIHPNIVSAYDAGDDSGRHFLVMEYIDGPDLDFLVRRDGPFDVGRAIDCLLQAARGLEFAHQHGVIHRDVKPSNLLMDSAGTVKILDLGLARMRSGTTTESRSVASDLTASGQVVGTIDYLAPEQAVDSHRADERCDIYSLGCTLYRLLHDRVLFEDQSVVARIVAHQSGEISSLSTDRVDVPQSLDRVFRRMVAKDPAARYQSMSDVIADLEAIQHAESIPLSEFRRRRIARRTWIYAAVVAAALSVILAREPLMQMLRSPPGSSQPPVSQETVAELTTKPQPQVAVSESLDSEVRGEDTATLRPEPEWAIPFSQRIAANPRDVDAYWLRARGYVGIRRFEEAINDCERALQVDPDCRSAYFWRGLARMNLDRYEAALADFRQSLKMREDDDWCLRHAAWILVAGPQDLRDPQEAQRLAHRAVELARERKRSSYRECMEVLAAAYYRLDEAETALDHLQEATAIDARPLSPRAFFFKAMCLHRLGEPKEARRIYKLAVRTIGQQQPDTLGDPAPIRSEAEELLSHPHP